MLLHALPVVILWIVLPLSALALLRNTTLPRLTMALTLAAGLLALLAISLPAGMMNGMMQQDSSAPQVFDMFLTSARQHYLIGLAMALFGAGGLVLLIGGLARGAKAGLFAGLGAFGLLLFYLSAGLQITRLTLAPLSADADNAEALQMHDMIAMADTISATGFLAGAGLILLLFVLTVLSLFKRG